MVLLRETVSPPRPKSARSLLEEDLYLYGSPLTIRIALGLGPGPFWSCDCAYSRFALCPARGVRRQRSLRLQRGRTARPRQRSMSVSCDSIRSWRGVWRGSDNAAGVARRGMGGGGG
jgi:hypothetical protein